MLAWSIKFARGMFLCNHDLVGGGCFTLRVEYFCAAAGRQGWPAGPGGAGSAQLPRGLEAVKVVVFFQYDLVSLCFNQKCVSFAWFGGEAGP
jgi:hypothetical protein